MNNFKLDLLKDILSIGETVDLDTVYEALINYERHWESFVSEEEFEALRPAMEDFGLIRDGEVVDMLIKESWEII